jgi:hypothetical protein
MNDDTFFHEVQDLYQRIVSADTDDFVELAKIANIDPKIYLKKVNLQGVNSNQTELNLDDLREATLPKVQRIDTSKKQNRKPENYSSLSFSQPSFGIRKSNFLVKFLWFCSGANIKVLEKCPVDQGKYAAIGFTILLTSVSASLSGGYAIWTIFNSIPIAAGLGAFWGLMIGNLDRLLFSTSSLRKKDLSILSMKNSIKISLIFCTRLLGAVAIAFVIAKPLQIRIFEKPIQAALIEQNSTANDFITKMRIMGELEKKEPIYAHASLLVILIFMFIDTAPVLAKFLLNRSLYDEILELEEKLESEIALESFALERESLSLKNDELHRILRLQAGIEKEAINHFYESGKFEQLINNLAQVHFSKISQEISHLGKEFDPFVYRQKIEQEMDETIENLTTS